MPSWHWQGKFQLYLSSSMMDRQFLSHYTNMARDSTFVSQHSPTSWRNHHQIIRNSPKYSLYIWVNLSTVQADLRITISTQDACVDISGKSSGLLGCYVVLTGKQLPVFTKVRQSQVHTSRTAVHWRALKSVETSVTTCGHDATSPKMLIFSNTATRTSYFAGLLWSANSV